MASSRFKACAFCSGEKLRRSGSVTSGREANSLDWFRSERSARAVQAGPDSSGCLRNFSCASTGKDDNAYSRKLLSRFSPLLAFREPNAPSCTFQRIVRSDHPVTLLTASLLIHNSALTSLTSSIRYPSQKMTKPYVRCSCRRRARSRVGNLKGKEARHIRGEERIRSSTRVPAMTVSTSLPDRRIGRFRAIFPSRYTELRSAFRIACCSAAVNFRRQLPRNSRILFGIAVTSRLLYSHGRDETSGLVGSNRREVMLPFK